VHQKRFLSLLHILHKLCTYLASRLTLSQMDRNKLPFDPHHVGVPLGASKIISEHMVCSARLCTYLALRLALSQTGRNKLPLDPHHLRVRSGVPKMICKPIACSAQIVHLSCIEINSISIHTELSFHLTHVI
jgi:hypothetical protein